MMEYKVAETIRAPVGKVWAILLDGDAYAEWDPNLERLEGEIEDGGRIKVFTKLSPGRAFPLKVELEPQAHRMTWTGGMPLGLFKGERRFQLHESAGGETQFEMREVFSGPLLGLIGKTIPDLTEAFDDFAKGLKARAEVG